MMGLGREVDSLLTVQYKILLRSQTAPQDSVYINLFFNFIVFAKLTKTAMHNETSLRVGSHYPNAMFT